VSFRVGFRVPDGVEVLVEPQHLAIFGLTQKSGKTTSLQAFARRVGQTTLVFRTKRGDIGFHDARRLEPFFRERVDWRFIEGLVSAQLQEKARFYRGDIILACRGARTVAEVHTNIRGRLEKARNPWTQKVLVELNEYLDEVEESLRDHRFADRLEFAAGHQGHIVDLEGYPPAMQQLVIASTLTCVMERYRNIVVVLPEARDFIPEDRLTPAKVAVESFIRKGATLGNYLWLDSQSLTGLDMDVMRHVGLWLFGRQTLDLEVRRDLKFLPGRRHSNDEITGLGLGQFLVLEGETVTRTYVQPDWLDRDAARSVAMGRIGATRLRQTPRETEEEDMDAKERKHYEDRIAELEKRVADLTGALEAARTSAARAEGEAAIGRLHAPGPVPAGTTVVAYSNGLESGDRQTVSTPRLDGGPQQDTEREEVHLHVARDAPSLTVHNRVVRVDATSEDSKGRLALLLSQGFFDSPRANSHVRDEMRSRGWGTWIGGAGNDSMNELLQRFCEWGFLRRIQGNKRVDYQVVPEARARVSVVGEEVAA